MLGQSRPMPPCTYDSGAPMAIRGLPIMDEIHGMGVGR